MNNDKYKGSEKMDKKFGTFRKATFGGFNRKDVISYIEKIKNETFEYRCQVEETIKKLNEKIFELEGALATDGRAEAPSQTAIAIPLGEGYTDIKDATQHLREVADELCSSLGDFIEKLSQRGLCDGDFAASPESSSDKQEQRPANDVESILSSIAFLNEPKKEAETDTKTQENSTQVGDILSSLSFLY